MRLILKMVEKEIIDIIKENDNFLIISHIKPDGDSIGSILALSRFLKVEGKDVRMAIADNIPDEFYFLLKRDERIENLLNINEVFSVLFILDCGELALTGREQDVLKLGKKVIVIDHHLTNKGYGDINLIDTGSVATCEIIFKLLSGYRLNKDIAEALLVGILTDTAFFVNSSVNNNTFKIVEELLNYGIEYSSFIEKVYYNKDLSSLKALGLALKNVKSAENNKIVWSEISYDELVASGFDYKVFWRSGIFKNLISVREAVYSFFLIEKEPNIIMAEFRCKRGYNVAEVASLFGGGGHRNASGCKFENTSIEKVEELILNELKKRLVL